MPTLDATSTVGDWVSQRPHLAATFESLGIDYCCGGKQSLAQACAAKGLDAQSIARVLAATTPAPAADPRNWADAPLPDLIEHIVQTHHAFLREQLPRLTLLAEKVEAAHGQNHRELSQVRQTYAGLRAELEQHMMKEEQILFPIVRAMATSRGPVQSHCGSVANPIRQMEYEHDSAGNALAQLRQLTSDYTVPADACPTYRAMLQGLAAVETDLHQHIHKENNILFPRAIQLEQAKA